MMTLEQERDHPKGATGGETSHAAHPSHSITPQPTQAAQHARVAHTHISPKILKPTHHPRRPRTPVKQAHIDTSSPQLQGMALDSLAWTTKSQRSGHSQRASQSLGQRQGSGQNSRTQTHGQGSRLSQNQNQRTLTSQGQRSPSGHGKKHIYGSLKQTKKTPEVIIRRGSETGVEQKLKKMACEVVVPPLPPPPDTRSRVPPQPASLESIESVNLMDLSSDSEQGPGSIDFGKKHPQDEGTSMEIEYSGATCSKRRVRTPLASPVWAANTVGSTYHVKGSPTAISPCRTPTAIISPIRTPTAAISPCRTPTAVISPSRTPTTIISPSRSPTVVFQATSPSPRKTSPNVLSPVVVDVSIIEGVNTADTVPLLGPNAGDSCHNDEDFGAALTGAAANTPGICSFISPAGSLGALETLQSTIAATKGKMSLPTRLPLLGHTPTSLSSPGEAQGDAQQRTGITSPAPLSTPDLRIDLLDSDHSGEGWPSAGAEAAMEIGSPPVPLSGFPAITPEDLTPAELHEFDMKYGSPHHARSRSIKSLARPTLLALPLERPRLTSLPLNTEDEEDDDYYRLRHFSINGRRIVNRGDSFKSRRTRSNTSVASDASRQVTSLENGATLMTSLMGACRTLAPGLPPAITLSCDDVSCIRDTLGDRIAWFSAYDTDGCAWSHPCSLATSAASSAASSQASSASEMVTPFRVVMLGSAGVGKTALVKQFMTSEHINAYDNSMDEEFGEQNVSVMLDGEESEIVFIDHPADEMTVENYLATYEPHAFVVVYSVVERRSFQRAEETLQYLWRLDVMNKKGVILVANKTDIVRARCLTPKEGSNLADSYDCKYIETSSGFNHQVDELLVGILKQVRLKNHPPEKCLRKRSTRRKKYRGTKTSASLKVKSFLTKVCGKEPKSKSCENLHVL